MISLFKSNPQKKLQKKYEKLMKQGYELSTVNRKESDAKYAEADRILKDLERLKS